jgi:peptidyl-prolyl cis-trans isomerase D
MLEAIRKRSASIMVKILFGLLILSFAAWGIGDIFRGRAGSRVLATVGDVDITPEQFSAEYQREMRNLQIRLGTAFDNDQARAMGIPRMVLSRLIEQTLYGRGASELGITVGDVLVSNEIRGNKAFYNSLGRFDRNLFQEVLQTYGFSEDQFAARIRGDMARGQLLQSLAAGAAAPDVLVDTLYRYRQEKRVADTILVADAAMTDIGEPDATTLAKFHQDNAAQFTAPEYRSLSAVVLEVAVLAKEVAIDDEKVRQTFEQRADQYNLPERRNVQQMVIFEEADANRAKTLLDEGRDFAEVAKEVAGLDAESLDLGLMDRGQLLPELADTAFGLAVNVHSAPVRSPLGMHIMRVTAIEPGRSKTLDEVRDGIATELAREAAIDTMFGLANKLEDSLGGGATLEEAARSLNLAMVKVDAIDAAGRGPDGKAVENLPPGEQLFVTTAFDTEEGTESTLTEAGTDGYFVLRVDKVTAPALRPLEEVKNDVLAAWRAEQRREAAEETAKKLLETIKGGADPATVAAAGKFTFKTTEPFVRGPGGSPDLPVDVVAALFDAKIGEAAMGRTPEGFQVARLKDVQSVDPGADKDGVEALRQQVLQSLQGDILVQYAGALRQRHPVVVNERLMDELF